MTSGEGVWLEQGRAAFLAPLATHGVQREMEVVKSAL